MQYVRQRSDLKILKKHKNDSIKFFRTIKPDTKTLFEYENVLFSDFVQGDIGNCGLISAIATLSQRPEFLKEIAPTIEHIRYVGIRLHFNMYHEGEPTTVTIDDVLPFDKNNSLVYARSVRKHNVLLCSLFEKAFVKLACNNSYERCIGTTSSFAFSCFSNCMTVYYVWQREETKENLMDYLAFEIDNKSSIVICVKPPLEFEPDEENVAAHAYVVMDYDQEHKAVKLYDQRCNSKKCVSNKKWPHSITLNADANKGELWVSMDKLEKRKVDISSLYSKNMYKSGLQVKRNTTIFADAQAKNMETNLCKVVLQETSTFMINLFSYVNEIKELELVITTTDSERRKIEINPELPLKGYSVVNPTNGEVNQEYYQRFELQPNSYIFTLKLQFKEGLNINDGKFLMKIGSVAECTFEELKDETFFKKL